MLDLFREDADQQTACLVEAYRILRGTAYQLHLVMQQNIVIQDLITFFTSREVICQHSVWWVAFEQALPLGELRVVTREQHVKGDARLRHSLARSLAAGFASHKWRACEKAV